MAKVKITGHASGTGVITVTAPNTSTDRVITLPDATGTLLNSDGDGSSLTGVGVAGITSTANATAITIDSAEKVGIGKVPETWDANWNALEVGQRTTVASYTGGGGATLFSHNAYSGFTSKYQNTAGATGIYMDDTDIKFRTAASGSADANITWTDQLNIKADGKVGIGTSAPPALLGLGQDSGSGDSAACSGVAFKTSNNDDMFQISTVGGGNAAARGLKFSVDGTEKMRMSGAGLLTKPYQPSFNACGSPSKDGSNYVHSFGTINHNIGSHYVNSTGRFTAPVAGRYLFTAGIWAVASSDHFLHLLINQSGNFAGAHVYNPGSAASATLSAVLNLAANDYVSLNCGYTIQGSTPRNFFSGQLLG